MTASFYLVSLKVQGYPETQVSPHEEACGLHALRQPEEPSRKFVRRG
jgi:hypothetical protein